MRGIIGGTDEGGNEEKILGRNVRSSITAHRMMTMASVSALEFEYIEYNVQTHIQQPAPLASSYIESTPVGQGLAVFPLG